MHLYYNINLDCFSIIQSKIFSYFLLWFMEPQSWLRLWSVNVSSAVTAYWKRPWESVVFWLKIPKIPPPCVICSGVSLTQPWFPGCLSLGRAAKPWCFAVLSDQGDVRNSQEMPSEDGRGLHIHPVPPFSLDNFRSWKSLSTYHFQGVGRAAWGMFVAFFFHYIPQSFRWVGDCTSPPKGGTAQPLCQKTSCN